MRRSRFREEQVIGILKEHQAGLSASYPCRGRSFGPFHNFFIDAQGKFHRFRLRVMRLDTS